MATRMTPLRDRLVLGASSISSKRSTRRLNCDELAPLAASAAFGWRPNSPSGRAKLGHLHQRLSITHRRPAGRQDEVVARIFSLGTHTAADVPHGRMKEEQDLDQSLQQVHERIKPADVGQLVRDQRLELRRIEAGGQRLGNKIIGRTMPTTTGTEIRRAPGDERGRFEADLLGLSADQFGNWPLRNRRCGQPQPSTALKGDRQAGQHEHDAGQVGERNSRGVGLQGARRRLIRGCGRLDERLGWSQVADRLMLSVPNGVCRPRGFAYRPRRDSRRRVRHHDRYGRRHEYGGEIALRFRNTNEKKRRWKSRAHRRENADERPRSVSARTRHAIRDRRRRQPVPAGRLAKGNAATSA